MIRDRSRTPMLLLESDERERARLAVALEEAGHPVLGVSSIAEVERWPTGDVVITGAERFTRWWKEMGATHVLVLANTPEEGAAACARGATMWVLRPCSPERLVAAVKSMLADSPATRAPRAGGRRDA